MKLFQERELREAYDHAMQGGMSLHLIGGQYAYLRKDTPSCFKGRRQIAHLFDQNAARLAKYARGIGVRVIRIEHPGTHRQHLDLCGKPLERAMEHAKQVEWEASHGLKPPELEPSGQT